MIHYMTTTGIGNAWVANELRVVKAAGIPFVLHGLRGPQQRFFDSDWAMELNRDTKTIYPLAIWDVFASMLAAPFLFGRRFFEAFANALFGERESFRSRIAALSHFFVACCWARRSRHEPISHIHAQWVHSSGSVAMYGAWLLGISFSFTGHAADLFRDRVALRDKVRRADFIICISSFHRDFFKKLGASDSQLHIVHCGIDLEHFSPATHHRKAGERLRILSSGRLVGKKGFNYLIDACAILQKQGVDFDCTIGGSGPLEDALRKQVEQLGLTERVHVTGKEITQEELPSFMHTGDVYCLPCVWAEDNDVDGLPQMLMEAMACGLPAISTRLVGIPDLVIDGRTGLLVEPNDTQQLAAAIIRLCDDPELAAKLATEGRRYCYERFDISVSLEPLLQLYRAKLGQCGTNIAERSERTGASTHSRSVAAGAKS
jgi:glycosyltransferase involved in cell wall biosynthesis